MSFSTITYTTLVQNAASGTHNVPMDATVNVNDILVVWIAAGNSGGPPASFTIPTGWTQIAQNAGSASRSGLFKKLALGTEGGTNVNFSTAASKPCVAICFRIDVSTTPGNGLADVVFSTGSATLNSPSLTSGFGAVDTTWISIAVAVAQDASVTNPTNYIDQHSLINTGTLTSQVVSATRQLNAATEDPGAWGGWTQSGDNVSFTIAVRGGTPPTTITEVNLENPIMRGSMRGIFRGI